MVDPLLDPTDLDGYPGAPFTPEIVDAACAYVRGQAGWHIAPVVAETFTVEAQGGAYLFLPTMRLVTVTAIRYLADYAGAGSPIDGWYANPTASFQAGRIRHGWRWPLGGVFEVDAVHGYPSCPEDLIPVVAQVARDMTRNRSVAQESVGPMSVTYAQSVDAYSTLGQYKVPAV